MLINPNLLDITKTTHTKAPYDFNTKITRTLENYHASRVQFELPDNLVVGQEYTFSCDIDNIDGNSELNVTAFPGTAIIGTFLADKGTQSYTFVLNDKNTHIYLYLGLGLQTKGSYKIYNIKLEEGTEATPYIPSKNILEPSKQAVFLAGGVFQEVYPL